LIYLMFSKLQELDISRTGPVVDGLPLHLLAARANVQPALPRRATAIGRGRHLVLHKIETDRYSR
jgi:hypothetical protein